MYSFAVITYIAYGINLWLNFDAGTDVINKAKSRLNYSAYYEIIH